jgi:hypothetical protein
MKIILGCIVETISTRQDGSLKFALGTQEIDHSQAGSLFQLRGKFVKCLVSDSGISPLEEKLVDEEKLQGGKKAKTPGQRLRNVMYRTWEKSGIQQEFEPWYAGEIETLIDQYKETLHED